MPTTSTALALTTGLGDPDRAGWRRPPIGPDQLRNDALFAAGMLVGGLLSMVL